MKKQAPHRAPSRPGVSFRDVLFAVAEVGVDFWGVFERRWSITYPLYKEVERTLQEARYPRPIVHKTIATLKYRGYLQVRRGERGDVLILTRKGKDRVRWHLAQALRIKRGLWDGRWRLILFDIPDTQRREREQFRRALARLGLAKAQESVWASPYPCTQEVSALTSLYKVQKHVRMVEGAGIVPDDDLRKFWKLESPRTDKETI